MKILENYIKCLLKEMSRQAKIDHRENYNHPGMVRDALYIHWVRNCYQFENNIPRRFYDIEDLNEKKKIIIDKSIRLIDRTLRAVNSVEISCNLVNANRSIPVDINTSMFEEIWGDIGFLIKPKVVTDSYSQNIGSPYIDVSQANNRKKRFRKRVRSNDDDTQFRELFVPNAREEVRRSFPLEDEEAYRKGVDNFTYNESEYFVVADEIVGIVILNIEDYFLEYIESVFDLDEDEAEYLYNIKRKSEKSYLSNISNKLGIPIYESSGDKIFDIPRTSHDL